MRFTSGKSNKETLLKIDDVQVKGSGVAMKRSFLERKGLTEAEIAQAFARVPEESSPLPAVSATPVPSTTGTGLVTYMPQGAQQPAQAAAPQAPGAVTYAPQQQQMVPYAAPPAPAPPAPQPIRWTQVLSV